MHLSSPKRSFTWTDKKPQPFLFVAFGEYFFVRYCRCLFYTFLFLHRPLQYRTPSQVYMVCVPGEPAYPVLAVCPPIPSEKTANSCQNGNLASTAETTCTGGGDENVPLGFLLKWETPTESKQSPAAAGTIGASSADATTGGLERQQAPDGSAGGMEAGGTDTADGEREDNVLHGSGGRRRGHGKVRPHGHGETLVQTAKSKNKAGKYFTAPRAWCKQCMPGRCQPHWFCSVLALESCVVNAPTSKASNK